MKMMVWLKCAVLGAFLASAALSPGLAQAESVQAGMLSTLNTYRAENRRKPLSYSEALEEVAKAHATDMVENNFKSHTGSDGSSVGQRLKRAGYKWCHASENITWGRRSFAKALAAWDASSGHRKNLLGRKAREVGVAEVKGIWVMVLARPC